MSKIRVGSKEWNMAVQRVFPSNVLPMSTSSGMGGVDMTLYNARMRFRRAGTGTAEQIDANGAIEATELGYYRTITSEILENRRGRRQRRKG